MATRAAATLNFTNRRMIFGLPWTSWLLIVAPAALGLTIAVRFWYVHREDDR